MLVDQGDHIQLYLHESDSYKALAPTLGGEIVQDCQRSCFECLDCASHALQICNANLEGRLCYLWPTPMTFFRPKVSIILRTSRANQYQLPTRFRPRGKRKSAFVSTVIKEAQSIRVKRHCDLTPIFKDVLVENGAFAHVAEIKRVHIAFAPRRS